MADKPFIYEEAGEAFTTFAILLLMKADEKRICVELTKIADRFAEVIKNSLLRCLICRKPQPTN
jgi:hypothetical protein